MPTVRLADRALVSVSGPDAGHLLQNLVTTDLDALAGGEARPGALLSPQGKILFDFLISRDGPEGFLLECRDALADDLVRRLLLYRLRARATIAKQDQGLVTVAWTRDSAPSQPDSTECDNDSTASGTDSTTSRDDSACLADRRFEPALGVRRFLGPAPAADAPEEVWTALRIDHGVAESGSDYVAGDAFPHDVNLDQTGGVGFRKGCYVGQEVVSRMQHRGTARRRVLVASAAAALPPPGTQVTAGGRPIGALGSVTGSRGLALARIDRAAEAMGSGTPIMAGGVTLALAIPPGASFGFPESLGGDEP